MILQGFFCSDIAANLLVFSKIIKRKWLRSYGRSVKTEKYFAHTYCAKSTTWL